MCLGRAELIVTYLPEVARNLNFLVPLGLALCAGGCVYILWEVCVGESSNVS